MPIFKRDNIIDVSSSIDALRVTQRGDGNSFLVEDTTNPDSSPFIITSAGRVGIGTQNPIYNLQVGDSSLTGFKLGIVASASANLSEINFGRSSSLSKDEADVYMGVVGYSHLSESLYLHQSGSRAVTISGSQNVGIGTTSPSSKLHVAGGNIRVDDTYGIIFGSSYGGPTGSSVSLNDYEEGTWTPQFSGSNNTFTYLSQYGGYVKVGKLVYVRGFIQIATRGGTLTNSIYLSNLPFSTNSDAGSYHVSSVVPASFTTTTNMNNIALQISNNSTKASLITIYNGLNAAVLVNDIGTGAIYFSLVYTTST